MGRLRFGPAGKPVEYKGPMEGVPGFLRKIGLDALEYEAVRGVRISQEKALKLREEAERNDVTMSMHAPYYINLASPDEDTWRKSIKRIYESMIAAEWMGAYVVVIHPGYYKGVKSREEALGKVIEGLKVVNDILPDWVKRPSLSPETMGKVSQVGDIDEVVVICREVDRCKPTVDWAHLYARYEGKRIVDVDEVVKIIEYIERELGRWAIDPLHTHFSKIEYGKGGERMHHTLEEEGYGPDWSIVCRAYKETGVNAVVISESPILEKDAIVMRDICREA
ncbi:MAG: deoxyribonuclease IV [Desulfurococcales archaeon]|nr:deoxyribonuclease IV [Desulfurococcales archaeon]